MVKLDIKPLSINEAYRGRRYATDILKSFKRLVSLSLPNQKVPEGKLKINIEFGFSSAGSDVDNGAKTFLDCLQKKYGFNDNRVYELILIKEVVKKGDEYIKFEILNLN